MITLLTGTLAKPKCNTIILPCSCSGIHYGYPLLEEVLRYSPAVLTEFKDQYDKIKQPNISDCIFSSARRLSRRGVDLICSLFISRHPHDLLNLFDISKSIKNALSLCVINKGVSSVAMPTLGNWYGGLTESQFLSLFMPICDNFANKIDITIIDANNDKINRLYDILSNRIFKCEMKST